MTSSPAATASPEMAPLAQISDEQNINEQSINEQATSFESTDITNEPTNHSDTQPESRAEQKKVVMDMEENTKIFAETLEKIKEEGTEVVLAMNEAVTWTINGSEITSEFLTDIDFAVTVGNSEIPEEKLTELVAGEDNYVEMSLAHEGEFGFDAVLTVDLENAVPESMLICSTTMKQRENLNSCVLRLLVRTIKQPLTLNMLPIM